ncbi:DUF2254 family protein [Methanococcus maripaludis]|uniref:DUF2254 domain-containing protein n=1 Tax=Methanococcus maripaludis TaxID=39152 RepID=A0A7J9PEB5_METMI|nr:DUF2254 family protein [Methanococcus maripaludis]MBA2861134.1 hypothetical protein [Methanococcus maripaludis]
MLSKICKNCAYVMDYFLSKEWFQVLIIAAISAVLAYYSLFYFAWGTGFDENLRYILSTLPQTQGAIVGIVASISIVAIQMVSQQYSTRITHLLLNKTFWGFIIAYIVSMSYEVLILGFMPTARIPVFIGGYEISYHILIGILFFFVYFDFLILLPYMKNTINGLKPENVIDALINSISKDEIKNYRSLDSENKDYKSARKIPKNTLRTVYYIIGKSLKSDHYMTARNGIILLGANYSVLAKKGKFKNKKFFESYIDNLKNLGLTAYGTSFSISREAIISLEKISKFELNRNYDLSLRALRGIKKIGLLYAQEYELKIDKSDEKELIHIVFEKLGNIIKFILSKPKHNEKITSKQVTFKIMMFSEILKIFELILDKLNSRDILKNEAAGTLILDALNNFSKPAIEFIKTNENSEFLSEITIQTSETLKNFVKLISKTNEENESLNEYLTEILKIYGIILDLICEKTTEKTIDTILSDISEIWKISNGKFEQIFGIGDIVENIDNSEKIKCADSLREQLIEKISKQDNN